MSKRHTERQIDRTKKELPMTHNQLFNVQKRERILHATREKGKVIYKGRSIRIIPDISRETLKHKRAWIDVL